LQVLAVCVEKKKSASDVCRVFTPYPHRLENLRYTGTNPLTRPEVVGIRAQADERLAWRGRLVLRASGTE
ncbi:phosphoglucosamine mutase, partial [Neokomagataea sp. TBRC 2177]|nr:phosphoglucosamine mutase [Neokomagataea anthophila]